eukprot:TRINITY_DN37591_c0_g1_i1.p2 TRINITY_DN37591_c0_g1~~TRINITY_DN37591_c0_g1_i1.p2  ORF type:complete len:121 (+),score=17.06 TRINITY_DN37591_c0_g1_i1:37-399(+)
MQLNTIARHVWQEYYVTVDAVVYLVDSVDKARFDESKTELDALLSSDELANVPFLILGNKIDVSTAASEEDLRSGLGLYETTGKESGALNENVRAIEVFMCSVLEGQGYGEGFRWLSQYI